MGENETVKMRFLFFISLRLCMHSFRNSSLGAHSYWDDPHHNPLFCHISLRRFATSNNRANKRHAVSSFSWHDKKNDFLLTESKFPTEMKSCVRYPRRSWRNVVILLGTNPLFGAIKLINPLIRMNFKRSRARSFETLAFRTHARQLCHNTAINGYCRFNSTAINKKYY